MKIFHVKIELNSIQKFIFRVPKLKYIIGANSIIGELLNKILVDLKKKDNYQSSILLSNEQIKAKIDELTVDSSDDIKSNFENDILNNSGGHFEVLFDDENKAVKFVAVALDIISKEAPGLRVSYYLNSFEWNEKLTYEEFLNNKQEINLSGKNKTVYHIDNPYFEVSNIDGVNFSLLNKNESEEVKIIEAQYEKFKDKKSFDNVSKLYNDKFKEVTFVYDIEELKNKSKIYHNNAIAVISIDGNSVGKSFQEELKKYETLNVFESFIEIEKFWYKKRKIIRESIITAIEKIDITKYKKFPFMFLMLGGDEVLMLSVPELSFDFVNEFYQAKKYECAAGIAFVKYNYPFSKACEISENCKSTAKILSKINNNKSAIDWHIMEDSIFEDISIIRRKNYCTLDSILTKRPYLLDNFDTEFSKKMNEINKFLGKDIDKIGRNKLKKYREILKEGKNISTYYGKEYFEGELKFLYEYDKNNINNALDYIELIDFLVKGDN